MISRDIFDFGSFSFPERFLGSRDDVLDSSRWTPAERALGVACRIRRISWNQDVKKGEKMSKSISGDFNQNEYINNYIKEKYDRINLTVPAGEKAIIKKRAEKQGKSANEYIRFLIEKDLEIE